LPDATVPPCRWRGDVLVCRLRVVPRSRQSTFAGLQGDRLKIRVAAPPVDGKANAELLAFMSRAFGVPRARVRVVAGGGSRDKTVEIEGPAELPGIVSDQLRKTRQE
jgi:uncharacterized protein (TIGR00251 family)